MPFAIHLPARALTLMQAACLFRSYDRNEIKQILKCAFLTPAATGEGLQIAATDGSAAFIGRVDVEGGMPEGASVAVDCADLEAAVKVFRKVAGAAVAEGFDLIADGDRVTLRAGSFEVPAPTVDCHAPEFQRVAFHAHNEPRGRLSEVPVLNVKYLEAVTKSAKLLQKESRSYDASKFKRVLLRPEIGGSMGQCFALDHDAIALVMGVRLGVDRPDYERTRAAVFGSFL